LESLHLLGPEVTERFAAAALGPWRPDSYRASFAGCGRGGTDIRIITEGIRSELRYRVAIRFEIDGDLRFISHRDTMGLFERALARAGLPVRFTGRFNPRPRISLPLPRAVGVASASELLVVELSEPAAPADVLTRLAGQMPEGLRLQQACLVDPGVAVQPDQVSYQVVLPADQVPAVAASVEHLRKAGHWPIERRGRQDKVIDLLAYVVAATVEAGALKWTARVTADGSIRPAEMLAAVGLAPDAWQHRVKRTWVRWLGLAWAPSIEAPIGPPA
jgi:radical SAM-linked protein